MQESKDNQLDSFEDAPVSKDNQPNSLEEDAPVTVRGNPTAGVRLVRP